ncbi:methyl-accepting chemotaxis protein [Litoribrevibacter euphylliae]|uniref:Methyl-accepting chemotaxis protein n=1 Tax=Litoribrevibacter euphylliae TaxID=1834034 RepID=A0ABV7HBS5_9GAMM
MGFKSLQSKIRYTLLAVLAVMLVVVSVVVSLMESRTILDQANAEIETKVSASLKLLAITDSVMKERVASSMALLKQRGVELGDAAAGSSVTVNGRQTKDLLLGGESQANRFGLVDGVTEVMGGTATLFVRDGSNFVRVSTNVMKQGKRAIGTLLAPDGKVIKLIRNKRPYYGQVDILGTPYVTGYEPVLDSSGQVVGIWYVGYKADLQELQAAVTSSHILETGFVALVDDMQRLRFHSSQDDALVSAVLDGSESGWQVTRVDFPAWNYQLIAAYPDSDIVGLIMHKVAVILLGAVVISALLMFVLGWAINSLVVRPVQSAMNVADRIAHGQFDNHIEYSNNDEVGRLLNSLRVMQQALSHFISQVSVAGEQLSITSGELSTVSQQTLAGVADQRTRTDSVATAMDEMTATVAEVARNASEAAEVTHQTDQKTKDGLNVVNQTMQTIHLLAEDVNQAAETINQLEKSTEHISTVVDVIRGIAEQTNLLALNAAIEAARAGEQGRGFAVVASEVRELATRTHESTQEISNMIDSLCSGARASVSSMQASSDRANESVSKADLALSALNSIAEAVTHMKDMNHQIASAAEEQSCVAEEVSRNVWEIRKVAEETSEGAGLAFSAMNRLSDLAGTLDALLRQYQGQQQEPQDLYSFTGSQVPRNDNVSIEARSAVISGKTEALVLT